MIKSSFYAKGGTVGGNGRGTPKSVLRNGADALGIKPMALMDRENIMDYFS